MTLGSTGASRGTPPPSIHHLPPTSPTGLYHWARAYNPSVHTPPLPPAPTHTQAMSGPLKVDFGCQTPVHFLERHIDKDYEWNVWALRRR